MAERESRKTADNPLADRLSRLVCYPYFALAHRFHWWGREHVPRSGPVIFAANHQSFYDPVLLSLAAGRRVIYLAIEHYFGYPVLGRLMRFYGAVPVRTENPGPSAYGRMVRALRDGRACGIFPEGGRSRDGLPGRPRPGLGAMALRTGAAVVPVTIWGAHRAWPPGRVLPRPGSIRLLFQEPIDARSCVGADSADRKDARRRVTGAVIHRIVDGLQEIAHPRNARAARRRLREVGYRRSGQGVQPPD